MQRVLQYLEIYGRIQKVFQKKPMPVNTGIQDCGVADVAQKVSRKLGVTKLIQQYFPENADRMLTAAQYMLSEGDIMCCIDEYSEKEISRQ